MSHNIQTWSREDSNQAAVPHPWTGIVTSSLGGVVFLVKCEAPTRREALILLREQLDDDNEILIATIFGDHSNAILDTEIF